MNISFDFTHPVDINVYKNVIHKLSQAGHQIFLTYKDRGKVKLILEQELKGFPIVRMDKHYLGVFGKIFGQLKRELDFIPYFRKNKIDLSLGEYNNVLSAWLLRIPHIAYEDDFEYKTTFYLSNIFATRHVMPDFIPFSNRKTYKYKGFKELAYLHPNYYSPSLKELDTYGLKPNEYVFIRHISNVSLNYKKENDSIFAIIDEISKRGLKILLSLENKSLTGQFSDKCIIIKEPVNDIYSLMYHSFFALSSGDTVARECSLLGVPTIYIGGRFMAANAELIKIGIMFKEDTTEEVIFRINNLSEGNIREKLRLKILDRIKNEWDDTTEIILGHANEILAKKKS